VQPFTNLLITLKWEQISKVGVGDVTSLQKGMKCHKSVVSFHQHSSYVVAANYHPSINTTNIHLSNNIYSDNTNMSNRQSILEVVTQANINKHAVKDDAPHRLPQSMADCISIDNGNELFSSFERYYKKEDRKASLNQKL
jgi:hypothetical protein